MLNAGDAVTAKCIQIVPDDFVKYTHVTHYENTISKLHRYINRRNAVPFSSDSSTPAQFQLATNWNISYDLNCECNADLCTVDPVEMMRHPVH